MSLQRIPSELPAWTFSLSREQLVRYAAASGDFNPIHYDDETAERFGLPGVIVHGMLNMGLMARYVEEQFGDQARLVRHSVRFRQMVRPGHEVTISGRVAEEVENSDGREVSVHLELKVAGEKRPAVTGTAVVRIPSAGV